MIDAIPQSDFWSSDRVSGTDRNAMGQDEFMRLLLTQLRHQDPMNPLEPHEFASQLANFSSVEQLANINDALAFQLDSIQMATALSKTSFSAALLGRSILAEGSEIVIPPDGPVEIQVDVGAGGGTATLRLLDDSGKEVASRDLGPIDPGRQSIALPDDLPEGTYRYELSVVDAEGGAVSVTTYTSGIVDRVLFEDGRILLYVDGMKIALEALVEIGPAAESGA